MPPQAPPKEGEAASPPAFYSLTPAPSPNGEGSEQQCLKTKRAFPWCEGSLSSMRRNAPFNRTNSSLTCPPVHSFTLPNHNFELWTLNFELHKGVCFCGFPCSFRNSVSPCGFVPSVYSVLREASPPPPLRMERGVNSIVCKQRGRFLDVKEASLQCDGTPPLIEQTAR